MMHYIYACPPLIRHWVWHDQSVHALKESACLHFFKQCVTQLQYTYHSKDFSNTGAMTSTKGMVDEGTGPAFWNVHHIICVHVTGNTMYNDIIRTSDLN